jgi:hypothetical protein
VHDLIHELAAVSLHHRNLFGPFNSARRQPSSTEDKLPPSLNLGRKHRQARKCSGIPFTRGPIAKPPVNGRVVFAFI